MNLRISLILIACLASLVPVRAQELGPQPMPAELRPSQRNPDVYLNDSLEAAESLAKLDGFVRRLDWTEAARLAAKLGDEHADSLAQIEEGLYADVRTILNRRVAAWPIEGLRAYRILREPPAKAALAATADMPDLRATLNLLDRYYCTETGIALGDRAAQLAIEAGRFSLAVRIYQDLLAFHPDRHTMKGDLAGRLAIGYALLGSSNESAEWRGEAERLGDGENLVNPADARPLSEITDMLLAHSLEADQRPASAPDWPMFAGHPTRNRTVDLALDDAASLWEFQHPGTSSSETTDRPDETGNADRNVIERGLLLSSNPVVAQNRLFVQSAARVWALGWDQGELLWSYRAFGEKEPAPDDPLGVPPWHSPTWAHGLVYAELSVSAASDPETEGRRGAALACLDGRTGQQVWRVNQSDLGANWDEKSLDSSPLVVGDGLLIVVRRQRVFGFEDCYLFRFNAMTGVLENETHLGAASTGGFGYRRATLSIPATDDDSVFVCTNMGAVAAVSADTGLVRWLRLYPRAHPEAGWAGGRGASHDVRPWHYNPVIIQEETEGTADDARRRILCLPLDADALLVFDAENGSIEEIVPAGHLEDAESILGVDDGDLYGVGRTVFRYDLAEKQLIWTSPLPADEVLYGRAVLTGDGVYLPTRSSWVRYDLTDGSAHSQRWEGIDGGGGNLLAFQGRLIVAGHDRITAYAPKAEVFATLTRRMEDRADDPLPALDLAERAIRNGETELSLTSLDEAVRRAGGFAELLDPALRKRLFHDCLEFADILMKDAKNRTDRTDLPGLARERAMNLYRYAAQCAPDAEGHLTYRLRWADLYLEGNQPAEAVKLYQQIIADRTLREADYPRGARIETPDGEGSAPAGVIAQRRVHQLIQRFGREVYAEFDAQAEQRLAVAARDSDLEALHALVQVYPNAHAAPRALLGEGELLQRQGRPLEATRALYTALSRYPTEVDPPSVMKRIADCYVEAHRPKDAWRWLTKAAREFPAARVDVNGVSLTLLDYRARLGTDPDDSQRPRIDLPLIKAYERELDDAPTLLEPQFAAINGNAWRSLLLYSQESIRAMDLANGQDLWPQPTPCRMEPKLLFATADRHILATRHQVMALDSSDGRVVWTYGVYPSDLLDPHKDWEFPSALRGHASDGSCLFTLHDDGRGACLDLQTGQPRWQRPLEHMPSGAVVMADPWLVYQGTRENRTVYCLLDLETGQSARVIDPADDRQILEMFFSLDGNLLLVTTQTIYSYDPVSGEQRWRRQLDRNLISASIALDLDGLYFSADGREVEKISLDDGHTLWRSMPVGPRAASLLGAVVQGGQLIVATERGVYSVDTVDGRVTWEGTVPPQVTFQAPPEHSEGYTVALHNERTETGLALTAYFYDHRHGSGLIPKNGGVLNLGNYPSVKSVVARDASLILQAGRTLHVWRSPLP